MMSEHLLSDEQAAAVSSPAPAIVVVASAGSGKTEVVARRVERILAESPDAAYRVLALSYTVKAADELAARFRDRLGDLQRRVDTDTIHGFAHSLLRQHGTRIGLPVEPEVLTRDEDRAEVLARWLEQQGREVPEDLAATLHQIDLARATGNEHPQVDDWNDALTAAGALDYAAMLERAKELLTYSTTRRQIGRLYAHVIVDEAQNLTPSQYDLLEALVGPADSDERHIPLLLVGDDKQSIVGFAGADPRLIARFEQEYEATRFQLTQNYRSAGKIVALGQRVAKVLGQDARIDPADPADTEYAADGIIEVREARDEEREGELVAEWALRLLADGLPAEALAPGESGRVAPEDIAVLSRAGSTLRGTLEALQSEGHEPAMASAPDDWLSTTMGKLAFELVALRAAAAHQSTHWQLARILDVEESDVDSVERLQRTLSSHPDALISNMAILCEPNDVATYIRTLVQVEVPSDVNQTALAGWEADCRQLTQTWEAFAQQTDSAARTWGNFRLFVLRQQRGSDLDRGIRLITVHKAQGREYRAVAVIGLNDGQFPDFRATTSDERVAELRTFYVAVTRPSRALLLTRAQSRLTRYGSRRTDSSPYLDFVQPSCSPA